MKSIVAMYTNGVSSDAQFTTLNWKIKSGDVFTESALTKALNSQIKAELEPGTAKFFFVDFIDSDARSYATLTSDDLVLEGEVEPVKITIDNPKMVVSAFNPDDVPVGPEMAEEVVKAGLRAKMDNLVGKAKEKISMPRRSVLAAGVGTAAAVGLELLSPNGSKISAATALVAGGAMTYKLNSVLKGIEKVDTIGIVDACVTDTTLFCALTGCGTFSVASAVGRMTASYFPGSAKEEEEIVILEDDGELILV